MYQGPSWQPKKKEEAKRYMGLTALQLDLAFFIVAGAAALAAWFFVFDAWTPGGGKKAVQATTVAGRYIPENCRFPEPKGRRVECGYLTVPENRTNPDSRVIRIRVAVFRTQSAQPKPDPIVYLAGGPGENVLDEVPYAFDHFFAPLLANRDLIVFDQRGAGISDPSLDCAEIKEGTYTTLDQALAVDQKVARDLDSLKKCRDRLVKQGVDLSAYNSAENASDLEDLRVALGYQQWNLYGGSYGTRLALTEMRDHPAGIRSVILDSTYPPEVDLYAEGPANTARAFEKLFSSCAADPVCASSYPNLEAVFYRTAQALNQDPVRVRVTDPISLRTFSNVVVNGDDFISTIWQGMYSEKVIPLLPEAIYQTADGNYNILAGVLGASLADQESVSDGMYLSVQCAEELPFTSADKVQAAAAAFPRLTGSFEYDRQFLFAACPIWGSQPPAPAENQPVSSDRPTLVTAGEFDPITPPAWGQQVADELAHSFFFQFPGLGHGVATSGDCPTSITMAFLEDPTVSPDGSCVAAMPGVQFRP